MILISPPQLSSPFLRMKSLRRKWGSGVSFSSSYGEDRPVLAFEPLWSLSRLLSGEGGRGRGRESPLVLTESKKKRKRRANGGGKSSKAIILEERKNEFISKASLILLAQHRPICEGLNTNPIGKNYLTTYSDWGKLIESLFNVRSWEYVIGKIKSGRFRALACNRGDASVKRGGPKCISIIAREMLQGCKKVTSAGDIIFHFSISAYCPCIFVFSIFFVAISLHFVSSKGPCYIFLQG